MKRCLNCGAEYQDNSLDFCDCGGPLVEINAQVSENKNTNDSSNKEDAVKSCSQPVEDHLYEENLSGLLEKIEIDDESHEDNPQSSKIIDFEDLALINHHEIFGEYSEDANKSKHLDTTDFESTVNDKAFEPNITEIKESEANLSEQLTSENSQEILTDKILIEVYKSKKKILVKELMYDEINIGRSKTGIDLEINLRDYDDEKLTSRKHAKIYKENGQFYIVRISEKAFVYLNSEKLPPNEPRILRDGDKIILSPKIGIIVRKAN